MKRNSVTLLALTLVVSLLGAGAAWAGKQAGWERLGERHVTDRVDHDEITVTSSKGDFKALRIHVKGHAVQIHDMKVHFANGGTQDVALRTVIPAGGESRVIDLEGADRVIRRVTFVYDAQALRGRQATVVLFGRN